MAGLTLTSVRAEPIKPPSMMPVEEPKTSEAGHDHSGDCCRRCGLVGGAGVLYVQPHWEGNPAFFRTALTGGLGAGARVAARQEDFGNDYEASPFAWVGIVNEDGAGVRVRYWQFDDGASASESNLPGVVNLLGATIFTANPLGVGFNSVPNLALGVPQLAFESDLQVTVWDLEVSQTAAMGNWSLTLAGGARYAHMSQSYNATEFVAGAVQALRSGHHFDGVGPTAAVEVGYGLGGGVSLYSNLRGSVLFGNGAQAANYASFAGATLIGSTDAAASHDDILPILEAEVGAEWSTALGGNRLFVQAGLVGQAWLGAGNAARSQGANFPLIGQQPFVPFLLGGAPDDVNLGFFGIKLAAGISF